MNGRRSVREGLLAGALGYVVVALFFAVLNLADGGSPFRTAFLIGEAVGAGTGGLDDQAGVVLAANGLHLVISLIFGVIAAWIVLEVEHHHVLWYAGLTAAIGGFMAVVVAGGVMGAELTAVASWPQTTGAALLFTVTVAAVLAYRHRALLRDLGREMES